MVSSYRQEKPAIFWAFSCARAAIESSSFSVDTFLEDLHNILSSSPLDFHDYILSIYGRLPYQDEFIEFSEQYRGDIALYVCADIQTNRFSIALPNALKISTGCKVIRVIHPPKTAGTALVSNIEAFTSIPVWSFDMAGFSVENARKLPDIFDNAIQEGLIIIRSHLTLSDQNHLHHLSSSDLTLILVRRPDGLLLSQAKHVARACHFFTQRADSPANIDNLRDIAEKLETGLPDHARSFSIWLRYCNMYPSRSVEYLLDVLQSQGFVSDYTSILRRFIDPHLLSSSSSSVVFLDSGMLNRYLTREFGIVAPLRFNESTDWFFGANENERLLSIAADLVGKELFFYEQVCAGSRFWK